MATTLSNEGLEAIARFEGLRLTAYHLKGEQFYTIGYGHYGPDVRAGQTITRSRALALLRQDTQQAVEAVRSGLKRVASQGQFDAMVSLAFNVGSGGFKGSTLLRNFNAGDVRGAAAQFLRWVRDSTGNVNAGLMARRKIEMATFLKGATGAAAWLTESELRWVREWDKLQGVDTDAARNRRRVLERVMRVQRKKLWRAAQNGGGWDVANRRARYRSLLARTS